MEGTRPDPSPRSAAGTTIRVANPMRSMKANRTADVPRTSGPAWAAWLPWIAALLAVLVTLPAITGGFVWDDRWLVLQSPLREHPGLLPEIVLGGHGWGTMEFSEEGSAYYRPVSNLLHGCLVILFGARPLPYRILSTILHAGSTLALAFFLRRRHPAAVWGAMLFAAHPILAEAFGWISAAPDILAGGFLFATLLCLETARPSPIRVSILWLLALLSKESAAVGVLWIPLLWLTRPDRSIRPDRRVILGLAAATLAYLGIRALGPGFRRPFGELSAGVIATGPVLVGRVVVADLWRLIVPWKILLTAPPWVVSKNDAWTGYAGLVLVLSITGASIWVIAKGKRFGALRHVALGVLLCLIGLVPVSQIVPTNDMFGGRFLYIPAAGLCLGLGMAFAERAWPRAIRAAFVVALCALAVRSGARAAEWRNDETLFAEEHRCNPQGLMSGITWAGHLINEGRIDEARPVVDQLFARTPRLESVRYLRALILMNDGKVSDAEAIFQDLALHWRATPTLLTNLAACQMREGRYEEGLATLDRATRYLTLTPGMRNNRGLALKFLGRFDEARREFERAVAADPSYQPARINLIQTLALDRPDPVAARRAAQDFYRLFPDSRRTGVVRALMDSLAARTAR